MYLQILILILNKDVLATVNFCSTKKSLLNMQYNWCIGILENYHCIQTMPLLTTNT